MGLEEPDPVEVAHRAQEEDQSNATSASTKQPPRRDGTQPPTRSDQHARREGEEQRHAERGKPRWPKKRLAFDRGHDRCQRSMVGGRPIDMQARERREDQGRECSGEVSHPR